MPRWLSGYSGGLVIRRSGVRLPSEAYSVIEDAEMEEKIRKKYEELKKKYSLPDFEELNKEFEISIIEYEDFLLREIRKKIADKINTMCEFFEDLLSPDNTIANLYEYKAFNDAEREDVFRLYKRLKVLEKLSLELSLNHDEKKDAEFINEFFSSWESIKNKIIKIIRKMRDFWEKESTKKENEEYFG